MFVANYLMNFILVLDLDLIILIQIVIPLYAIHFASTAYNLHITYIDSSFFLTYNLHTNSDSFFLYITYIHYGLSTSTAKPSPRALLRYRGVYRFACNYGILGLFIYWLSYPDLHGNLNWQRKPKEKSD